MLFAQRRLHRIIDRERVKQAIHEAERLTSGEIRVSVAPFFWGNLQAAAERSFRRLGMTDTRHRNGILLFLVPSRRRFVVLGDEGIHAKVGPEFWKDVADAMSDLFRKGDFTGGLIHGIETVGKELASYFPPEADATANELPDEVDFGGKS